MTVEDALAATVSQAVAPLVAAIRELRAEVAALRSVSPPQWLSQIRAAELLGCSVQTVAAMGRRGEVVTRHAGRRVLVDAASLRGQGENEIARLARQARMP